jgi:HK97 family phage major capsid protein
MKYSNTLEYQDAINQLVKRNMDIIKLAKTEERELTEDEENEFNKNEEEVKELCDEKDELEKSLENPEEDEKEEKSNKNINVNNMEKKNFSIVDEIRKSMKTHEPIVLNRSTLTVAAEGEDVVATEVYDVWEPLRANNVLVDAGMRVYSGLVGDVQIPLYSKGNVQWKGETATAEDGNGAFTNVTLSPKRITGKFPISLQFLAQTTPDVEACIRKDIALAVMEKIESTLLGSAAGSSTQPAGLAYNASATTISNYAALTGVEADIESYNYPNIHFVASPHFKGAMKAMEINDHGMIFNDGKIDEYPTEVTSNVASSYAFVGDFSNLALGLWDEVRIDTVADSATLSDGQIMIIVNAFADAKLVRDNAVKYVKA